MRTGWALVVGLLVLAGTSPAAPPSASSSDARKPGGAARGAGAAGHVSGEWRGSGGGRLGEGQAGGELRLRDWELQCRRHGAGERLHGGLTGRLAGGRLLLAAGDLLVRYGTGALLGRARLEGITSMPRTSVRVSTSSASSAEGPLPGMGLCFLGRRWTSTVVVLPDAPVLASLDDGDSSAEGARARAVALSFGRSARDGSAAELALAHWRVSAPGESGSWEKTLRRDTRGTLTLARRSRPRAALVELSAGTRGGASAAGRFTSELPGGEVMVEIVASRAETSRGESPSRLEASLETRWLLCGVHRLAVRHLVRRAPGLAWRGTSSGRGETILEGSFRRGEWGLRATLSRREDLGLRSAATSLPQVTAFSCGVTRGRRWGSLGVSWEAIAARSARGGPVRAGASGWMVGFRFDRQDNRRRAAGGGGARGGVVFFRAKSGAAAPSFYEGGVEGGRTRRAAGTGSSGWCLLSLPGRIPGGWSIGLSLTRFSGRPWECRVGVRCDR